MLKFYQIMHQSLCFLNLNQLDTFKVYQDTFFKFYNHKGFSTIYYTNKGIIYVPKCVEIQQIEILNNLQSCYKDIPVKFLLKNKTQTGF